MAFEFKWPAFSDAFYADATQTLESALNKGTKPAIIADRITVKELSMGTLSDKQPPDLEILEIGDLSKDRFRGIFRLTYNGDAHIELQTSIQANPLSQTKPALDILASQAVFAAAPLIVPMRLKLSDLKLKAIIVLVISRHKGITLVFKNDPLESVNVSSSFDSVSVIQGYIQRSIEGQLREMFRTDLPGVIHKLSQRWLSETSSSTATGQHKPFTGGFSPGAKVETRTAFATGASTISETLTYKAADTPITRSASDPTSLRQAGTLSLSELADQSVAESIAAYDPTYGMRPEELPNTSTTFTTFEKILDERTQGMGSLLNAPLHPTEEEDIHPHDSASGVNVGNTSESFIDHSQSFERLPAVGGGFITRPRVLHAQSQIVVPTVRTVGSSPGSSGRSMSTVRPVSPTPQPSSPLSFAPHLLTQRPGKSRQFSEPLLSVNTRRSSWQSSQDLPPPYSRPSSSRRSSQRPSKSRAQLYADKQPVLLHSPVLSQGSSSSRAASSPLSRTTSYHSNATTPLTSLPSSRSLSPLVEKQDSNASQDAQITRPKRSISPPPLLTPAEVSLQTTSSSDGADQNAILLSSARNDSCAHIATLSDQFQTLSPFTRPLNNFTARSVPPHMRRAFTQSDLDKLQPKRKRLHRIGSAVKAKQKPQEADEPTNEGYGDSASDSGGSLRSMSDYFPHISALQPKSKPTRPLWQRQSSSSQIGLGTRSISRTVASH